MGMTGFYKNMSTGDYDKYRDTEDVRNEKQSPKAGKIKNRKPYNPEDDRTDGDDDYEY